MSVKLSGWVDVFDCAENKQKNVTPADLKQAAANYDPAVFHAPVTTDHKEAGPASGRLKAVKAEGNKFFVKFEEMSPQLIEHLKSGAYKYRSAEFYKNLNGKGFYPRAVSFVQFPECKSQNVIQLSEELKEEKAAGVLSFSEQSDDILFPDGDFVVYEENTNAIADLFHRVGRMFQKLRDKLIAESGVEKTDDVISPWDIDSLITASGRLSEHNMMKFNEQEKEDDLSPEELEKIKKQVRDEEALKFSEKLTGIETENKELLKFKEDSLRAGFTARFDALLADGKVLPKHKEGFLAFMEGMSGNALKFAETEVDALKFFEDYMADVPKNSLVDLSGQKRLTPGRAKDGQDVMTFSEEDESVLHEKVLKFSEAHNVSYDEAFEKVVGGQS